MHKVYIKFDETKQINMDNLYDQFGVIDFREDAVYGVTKAEYPSYNADNTPELDKDGNQVMKVIEQLVQVDTKLMPLSVKPDNSYFITAEKHDEYIHALRNGKTLKLVDLQASNNELIPIIEIE